MDGRQDNKEAMQKNVGIAELDGAQLPRDVFDRFIERVQKESQLLGMARAEDLPRLEMSVPKLGVSELSGDVRGEETSGSNTSTPETGAVEFNATDQSYYIQYDLRRDAVKNMRQSADEVGDLILSHFERQWAVDVELIGVRAGATSGNLGAYAGRTDLDTTYDGWIAIAEGSDTASNRIGTGGTGVDTMPEYNHTDGAGESQPVETRMFNNAIQTVPRRYRDPENQVILMSNSQVQQYHYDLTGRQDGLGTAVLMGDSDVTPFDYDIVGLQTWPDEYAMLIDPEQLAWGMYEEMEIEQVTESDKTFDDRLHSRNKLEGQFDFQIEELQSGALVTGIAAPEGVVQ